MGRYTAGEVLPLMWIAEVTYGVTPTTAMAWGGDVISLRPDVDLDKQYIIEQGNRSFGTCTVGARKARFALKYYNRPALDWRSLMAYYCYGSTTGLADHEGSFSALVGIKQGSSYKYNLYNGCKINKGVISCEKPGMPLVYEADVIAQWVQAATALTGFSGLQSPATISGGTLPTPPAAGADSWLGILQLNLNAGGLANFYPRKWSLTVDNHMEAEPGNALGADAVKYGLDAGQGVNEGGRDIIFTCTKPAADETWTNAKLADLAVTALTIPIGSRTITLSGGVFNSNLPERKQALMDEDLEIRFNAMSIA